MGIEAALLGTAATAATSTTAATAATAGLIGTGGTLFGISGLTGSALLGGLGAASSLMSGYQSLKASKVQQENAISQTKAQIQENARVSVKQANAERKAADITARQQKLAYLSSGVSLSGSPLLVLAETRSRGESNAKEILAANTASTKAIGSQTDTTLSNLSSSGRRAFIGALQAH